MLAVTAPYNCYDNYSGNLVINTSAGFGPGSVDVYTALLQEAGHAFGIGNSPDVNWRCTSITGERGQACR